MQRADVAIKSLEAERVRLQGTQMNLERNAVQAIHDAVQKQSGGIERQVVNAEPLREMKQAAGFVCQSLKEVSWLMIGLMLSAGLVASARLLADEEQPERYAGAVEPDRAVSGRSAATGTRCARRACPNSQGKDKVGPRATAPITMTGTGEFGDTGGMFLIDAIKHAQFVLVGESHFSQETPLFAAAVCRTMHPDSYAVEAGPYAAEYVNGLLKSADRKSEMQKRERAHPANMAFLVDEQENDLAANCSASTRNKNFALWGLDQEFLGAASVLLMQMNAQSNGSMAAAAIRAAEAKDKQAEAKAKSSGDATQLFLVSASDSDIYALEAALGADGTPTSQAIMREWIESRRIYQLNMAGASDSNAVRASLLKQHFLDHYRALQQTTAAPRVLLKFGDNHIWKGFNDLHQLDLGDFVAELASVEHTSSLHIQVLAAKGMLAGFGGYARPLKSEPFVLSELPEYSWLKPVIDMLPPEAGAGSRGVIVDLRKMRFKDLAMSKEWEHLIYGYDLLVMLPEFTPAHFYQ